MATWLLEYGVVLALGTIAGLLLRYLIAVVAVLLAGLATLGALGYADSSLAARASSEAVRWLGSLPWGTLFTLIGATFVLGLLLGVLLTTRVRLLEARSFA